MSERPRDWRRPARLRLVVTGCLLLAAPVLGQATAPATREKAAATVVASPDLRYTAAFVVSCSETTWIKVLDNPWLMGQLWAAYGHSPAYRIRVAGDALHVDDPTGLTGTVVIARTAPDQRRYFAAGTLNHRAVPFFNAGQAVGILRSESTGRQIRGTLEVYVRADRAISRAALWVGRPLLQPRVENRIRLNLIDAVQIVDEIASSPESVLGRLQGPAAETFRTVFLPPKPKPATPPKAPKPPRPRPRR